MHGIHIARMLMHSQLEAEVDLLVSLIILYNPNSGLGVMGIRVIKWSFSLMVWLYMR